MFTYQKREMYPINVNKKDLRLAKYWEGGIIFTIEDVECLDTNQSCLSFYEYIYHEIENEMKGVYPS